MKEFFVYLAISAFPTVTGIMTILVAIFASIFQFLGLNKIHIAYISSFFSSFITLYIFSLLFKWLNVDFGIFAVLLAITMTFLNSYFRIKKGRNKKYETTIMVLEILGSITFYLLLKL